MKSVIFFSLLFCLPLSPCAYQIKGSADGEVLEAGSDDPLVIVDQQNAEEETRLPNAHSATFVMGFIFLCLFFYGVYRVCKCHCIQKKQPLTVNLDDPPDEDGLEKHIKEHNDYLAIFGPKKQTTDMHVCEFKKSDGTNGAKQSEPRNF